LLTILVINSKGGSGKTTLTTNLAAYYADRRFRTAIIDYDPQSSSLHWLKARPTTLPAIHAANGAPAKGNAHLSSRQGWVPLDTEVLIVDAPAGASGLLLKDLVRKANFIVIPVAPSPIVSSGQARCCATSTRGEPILAGSVSQHESRRPFQRGTRVFEWTPRGGGGG
jgi:chromosome partitioning protein